MNLYRIVALGLTVALCLPAAAQWRHDFAPWAHREGAQPLRPWRQRGQNRFRGQPSPIDQLDRLEHMTPQQREQLLGRLPPERRGNIERRLQRYHEMNPEQRRRLREQYEMFRQLPPEDQQAFRRLFARFMNQPPERQELMRQELQQLRHLPPGQRAGRLESAEFRRRFGPNERDILGRMSDLLP